MFKLHLYLYNSAKSECKGEELENVLIGSKMIDTLDDTINTYDLTVINTNSSAYQPTTKMILDLVSSENGEETILETTHWVVREDVLNKVSMDEDSNLWKHELSLGNPAIIMQKRSCDNFSMTYKLKDVTLDNTTVLSSLLNSVSSSTLTQFSSSSNTTDNIVSENTTDYYAFEYNKNVYSGNLDIEVQRYFEFNTKLWSISSSGLLYKSTSSGQDWATSVGSLKQVMVYDNPENQLENSEIEALNNDGCMIIPDSDRTYDSGYEPENTPPAIILNSGTMVYTYNVPTLYMYSSDTESEYAGISTDNSLENKQQVPTITEITVTDIKTGESTTTTYNSSVWAQYLSESLGYDRQVQSIPHYDYRYVTIENNPAVYLTDLYTIDNVKPCMEIGVMYKYEKYDLTLESYLSSSLYTQAMQHINYQIPVEIEANKTYTFKTYANFNELGENALRFRILMWKSQVQFPSEENSENKSLFYQKLSGDWSLTSKNFDSNGNTINGGDIYYTYSFSVVDKDCMYSRVFKASSKPTAYDLFVKAQVSTEPKLYTGEELERCTSVDTETQSEMESVYITEDTYQQKNLWQVYMEIGKYMHAKPYITFSNNGNYLLHFNKYGISDITSKETTKNSIYNSRNVENYINACDMYISNLVQVGGVIQEFLKPQDNDGSKVCITDNAVLKTKYPINEIVGLYVFYSTSGDSVQINEVNWTDITEYVFEHNIYNVLPLLAESGDFSYSHYRGNSIYYHLGETQIMGLQYKTPSPNNDANYAIKQILIDKGLATSSTAQINRCIFKIIYRTKDNLRVQSFRPDIRKYLVNSAVDTRPMQYQFSNQADKYIDSKKVGENTYGKLIRTGNDEYKEMEYVSDFSNLKKAGELVRLEVDNNLYYVSKVSTVIYTNHLLSEVEYSKDFNKLSEIISIDSEPRFYEISEQSNIERNIVFNKFIKLTEDYASNVESPLSQLLAPAFLNYRPTHAYTFFKGMHKSTNTESNDYNANIVSSVLPYNMGLSYVVDWKMEDNYSAGDTYTLEDMTSTFSNASWLYGVLNFVDSDVIATLTDSSYSVAEAVRYCDVYGKADLVDFVIDDLDAELEQGDDFPITRGDIREMPTLPDNLINNEENYNHLFYATTYSTDNSDTTISFDTLQSHERGYYIDKDNREQLKFTFQVNVIADSDRYNLSSSFWQYKVNDSGVAYNNFYVAFLGEEVNKMNKDTLTSVNILKYVSYSRTNYYNGQIIPTNYITETEFEEIKDDIKAIALIYNIDTNLDGTYTCNFMYSRNVSDLGTTYEDLPENKLGSFGFAHEDTNDYTYDK